MRDASTDTQMENGLPKGAMVSLPDRLAEAEKEGRDLLGFSFSVFSAYLLLYVHGDFHPGCIS